ncbi:hypothetical protein [Pseudoalteromonas sp. B62]|uniref:hypothetical protein n=1 Tax=Pseudoalteromonas sp. B62 TaxID=630483 RepID=UPI00301BA891
MFFFGMNKVLKTYLKLIVKPQIEATSYYQQSSEYQNFMREYWLSEEYVSCYIFSLVYIAIRKENLSKPTKHYCDAYDYLFGSCSRDLLKRGDFLWNNPDSKHIADEMFELAKSNVALFSSQLESGQTPDYNCIQNMVEKNPLLKEIESI